MSSIAAEQQTQPDAGPETIYEDEAIRVSGLRGGDEALFVAFTGIGHRLGALQREEFVRTAQGGGRRSALFVHDKTRSWYNDAGFLTTLQPIVADWAKTCARTITIGNSMGGFGAVVFAGALKADTAIAFSPQYSVSPKIVPQETRWRDFREKIAEFRYESAGPYISDECRYFVFQGDASRDWYQIGGFPIRPNVNQFIVRGGAHNLAAELRARRVLSELVEACAANDIAAVEAIAVGRVGAFRRATADDSYATGERPRSADIDADDEDAPDEPAVPESEEAGNKLLRYHQRREKRSTERAETIAAAREAERERLAAEWRDASEQRKAERQAILDRLAAEREARAEERRAARIAERRAAAIARGEELAAAKTRGRRAKPGIIAKLRRKLGAFVRRIAGAVGLSRPPHRSAGRPPTGGDSAGG